jgi:hypothetical protein
MGNTCPDRLQESLAPKELRAAFVPKPWSAASEAAVGKAFECADAGLDLLTLSRSPADCRKCSGMLLKWLRKRRITRQIEAIWPTPPISLETDGYSARKGAR